MGAALRTTDARASVTRKPLPFELAEGYAEVFGLHMARASSHYTWKPVEGDHERLFGFMESWTGRRSYTPSWQTTRRTARPAEIAVAFFDSTTRIAPREMSAVRHVTIDVDVHGMELPPLEVAEGENVIDLFVSRKGRKLEKARARRLRAALAYPVLEELMERVRFDIVEATPRGWHLTVLLDRDVTPSVGSAIGKAIVEGIALPNCVCLESFPKLRSDGKADHCALPLLGPGYRCRGDFVSRDGMRKVALAELLATEAQDPADLAHALGVDLDEAIAPVVPVANEEATMMEAKALAPGQLFGEDFAVEMLRLFDEGISAGESYSAARRFAFGAYAIGLTDEQIVEAARRWFEDPRHEANHCRTERKRRQLLGVVRANLRYYARGENAGRLRRGRMRSTALHRKFNALIAVEAAPKEDMACATSRPRTKSKSSKTTSRTASRSVGTKLTQMTSPPISKISERSRGPADSMSNEPPRRSANWSVSYARDDRETESGAS